MFDNGEKPTVTSRDWTRNRHLPSFSTNTGGHQLPFQGWRHFKVSFAPAFVAGVVSTVVGLR